jgi:hypothetical protein
LILLLAALAAPAALRAQLTATPVLEGTAFVGDTVMTTGTIVLHHLTEGSQSDPDSTAVGADGTFAFPLPNVPDPDRGDIFFASVRHQGVLYFGPAITAAVQLDSIYEIQAYDTLMAPSEGLPLALQSRSVFFQPDSVGWMVTDVFQLRNDEARTIVARPEGRVWSHPLPVEARDVAVDERDVAFDAVSYEQGSLVVRAAIPPGERLLVVRYRLDSPLIAIPNLGPTDEFDVLIREPAPPVEVEGLDFLDRVEIEAGTTYTRFGGADVAAPFVRIVETERERPPPGKWMAVILALVLAGGGLVALRSGFAPAARPKEDRRSLLLQVARLDEEFESGEADPAAREEYEKRREELLSKLRSAT